MRVLVVEDDSSVAELLRAGLTSEGHTVTVVADGQRALHRIQADRFDAIILDVMLPDMSGIDLTSQVRRAGRETPILMLTARDALPDRLQGFEAGADDYLTKPFAFKELCARLRAITRRATTAHDDEEDITVGDLVIGLRAHEVSRAGKPLVLTPREFTLLEYMARHEGKALSRTMILDRVWGNSFESFGNVVDATIRRLRKAVDEGFDKPLIQTVRGVGYKIKA